MNNQWPSNGLSSETVQEVSILVLFLKQGHLTGLSTPLEDL